MLSRPSAAAWTRRMATALAGSSMRPTVVGAATSKARVGGRIARSSGVAVEVQVVVAVRQPEPPYSSCSRHHCLMSQVVLGVVLLVATSFALRASTGIGFLLGSLAVLVAARSGVGGTTAKSLNSLTLLWKASGFVQAMMTD